MAMACNEISCGPELAWAETENKRKPLVLDEESPINIPAIAAAHVIKGYTAQAPDELSFEVGDIVCVIDMPAKELSIWWRGKHGFQVVFFPSECVELIKDEVPQSLMDLVPKPVSKKHGKIITFLRSLVKARPKKAKQWETVKDRVFGCDLAEHLLHSGQDVPQVLKSCVELIEQHGVVRGIYRLSGVTSRIQKLRQEFESEQIPELTDVRDVHSVSSLCKMYFRELPSPLLCDHLYEKFSEAVSAATDEERLVRMQDILQQLPPPHYRTLEYLMRHLACLAGSSAVTNMHAKNLAIVWAPNLLRSPQSESACVSGGAAFMEVQTQSAVVEFILNHTDVLFGSNSASDVGDGAGHGSSSGPKSAEVSSPCTKLLTLEEAQARARGRSGSPIMTESREIEVGEGPAALQGQFHTVIDFPHESKCPPRKTKNSPAGCWCLCFSRGRPSSVAKRRLQRNPREPSPTEVTVLAGGREDSGTLGSANSAESLTTLHAVEGESSPFQPGRARASSGALCAAVSGELSGSMNRCPSDDSLPLGDSDGDKEVIHVCALISPGSAEDAVQSVPEVTVSSLECDPTSSQSSPPQAESECSDSSTSLQEQDSVPVEKQSLLEEDVEAGSQSQTAGSTTSSEPVSL
ncbi:rho GTPase-activating protein 32-like isoform X2 [Numida meleagris]|nr:rho GTPase-activating protein 32-like isoform X2 [Numida meleagris]